ncbi:MAG: flagellar export protein FliJ [Deferribacterales bacterium]
MKRTFRLQKVLEYRERLVDIEKNKLADVNAKLERTKAHIIEADRIIEEKVEEKQNCDHAFKTMYDKYIKRLTMDRNALIKLRRQLELNIELQKKKVVEAIERHKIMLKLKEKHVENYRAYLNKEEMKMIDELAVTRSGNNEN